MLTNHLHYFDNIAEEIKWTNLVNEGYRFTKPEFVGQGWTYSVGSDSYGGYVTEIKTVGNKVIYGLVNANCIMHSSWTEGTLDCSMPIDRTPTKWIVQRGWWKDKKTGEKIRPKFFFCNKNGVRFTGALNPGKCNYSWNGASSYRDPSF